MAKRLYEVQLPELEQKQTVTPFTIIVLLLIFCCYCYIQYNINQSKSSARPSIYIFNQTGMFISQIVPSAADVSSLEKFVTCNWAAFHFTAAA